MNSLAFHDFSFRFLLMVSNAFFRSTKVMTFYVALGTSLESVSGQTPCQWFPGRPDNYVGALGDVLLK